MSRKQKKEKIAARTTEDVIDSLIRDSDIEKLKEAVSLQAEYGEQNPLIDEEEEDTGMRTYDRFINGLCTIEKVLAIGMILIFFSGVSGRMLRNKSAISKPRLGERKHVEHHCDHSGGFHDCRNKRGVDHDITEDESSNDDAEFDFSEWKLEVEEEEKEYQDYMKQNHTDIIHLPPAMANLEDLTLNKGQIWTEGIPLFFHIPRVAGVAVEDAFSVCYHLVEASQVGVSDGHQKDNELKVIAHENGARFVNVDTTTLEGIQKAKKLHLAESRSADIIFTSYLHEAARDIFSEHVQGVCFTLMRHPIERSISLYYHRRNNDPAYTNMSFEDYIHHGLREDNWVTRFLANKETGTLYEVDFLLARHILETKCLIGFMSDMKESMRRFEIYFRWHDKDESCMQKIIDVGQNVNKHESSDQRNDIWLALEKKNYFDLKLFDYAQELYREQAKYFV